MLAIYVLLATAAVTLSRKWYAPELGCWIIQEKLEALCYDDAKKRCEKNDAILASPLNPTLLEYMKSLISVNNHSVAYFIGIRGRAVYWKRLEDQTSTNGKTALGNYNLHVYVHNVNYTSVEGKNLDEMPRAVHDEIDLLNVTHGECLSMDRNGIHSVSCKDPLPFICYSKENEDCGSATTTQAPTTQAPTTQAPTTQAPTTQAPETQAPMTQAPETPAPVYTCYKPGNVCYKFDERHLTWDDAKTACAKEGTQLLVLNDAEEAIRVQRIVMKAGEGITSQYVIWLGVRNYQPEEGVDWRTVDGKPLSDVYHEWGKGEPTNDPQHKCAYFYAIDGQRKMYNGPCDKQMQFICKIQKK